MKSPKFHIICMRTGTEPKIQILTREFLMLCLRLLNQYPPKYCSSLL